MIIESLTSFLHDPVKLTVSLISLMLAATVLYFLVRKSFDTKTKILLIYLHLFFLSLPLILLSYSISCSMGLLNGIIGHCATIITKVFLISIPACIIIAAILGYILIPLMYIGGARKVRNKNILSLVKRYSKRLDIKAPDVYLLNTSKPLAFSFTNFKSAIFLSLGLTNLLTRKELESVLLHELYHVKNKSAIFKFSTFLIKFSPFSTFATFNSELNREEIDADRFAVKVQKTFKYITSTKRKINGYNKYFE